MCSTGRENAALHQKLRAVSAFWEAGVRADFLHESILSSLEDLEAHCAEAGIPYLLLVKGDGNSSLVLKRCGPLSQDLKVSLVEAVSMVQSLREPALP